MRKKKGGMKEKRNKKGIEKLRDEIHGERKRKTLGRF
jgi:hypothetical protein